MTAGKFFLLAVGSLLLYTLFINFGYIKFLRVKSSIIKNNSSIWIYGIFKLAHLRKIQTPRKELFHV